MPTDIGEYAVGAYLRLVEKCDFVDYNVRTLGGGRDGLNELDVLGLNFQTKVAYVCEVTTHICGTLYSDYPETVRRIRKKFEWQITFAERHLPNFETICYQFWSPVVPKGTLTTALTQIEKVGRRLELIINGEYKRRIQELRKLAKKETRNTQNPVFRVLQILEHLRDG